MAKIKKVTAAELQPITERNWVPVQLSYGSLPEWLRRAPPLQRLYVYASGSHVNPLVDGFGRCIIGGIDILRDARSHGDPVNLNRDHYIMIRDTNTDDAILVKVPLKHDEHWINDIPEHLKNVEFLSH